MRHSGGGRSFTARTAFNVPAVSGNYASERITLGVDASGKFTGESFSELSVLVEGSGNAPLYPTGISVELWVPGASASNGTALTDADYTLAGTGFAALTAAGLTRWAVGRLAGAQIRVKATAAGLGGQQYVSVTAG
jgi:hypothetical protein